MRALSVKTGQRPQNIAEFVRELTAKTPLLPRLDLPAAPPSFSPAPVAPSTSPATGGWGSGAPQTPGLPPQNAPEEKWFHSLGGRQTGPMARLTMQNLVRSGVIKSETLIWREGMGDWVEAGQSEWASQLGASSYGDFTPANRPQETDFDPLMMSVPAWAWRTLWISLFLIVAGRTALGIVRYQNGDRDFGRELSAQVMQSPEAAPLTQADMEPGEGRFDSESLTNKHDNYVGEVRYRDGDVGNLSLSMSPRAIGFISPKNSSSVSRPAVLARPSAGRSWRA